MDQPDGSARGGRREESAVSSGCQILNEVIPSASRISASLIGHMCLRANKCPDMADYYMWIGELNPSVILAKLSLIPTKF